MKKLFSNSIKHALLSSYIIMLIIFILVSGSIFLNYRRNLDKQANELNEYVSRTISSNIENVLTDMKNICFNISVSPDLYNVLRENNMEKYYHSSSARNLIETIKTYQQLNNISLIYVYIPGTDTLLSSTGIYSSQKFYSIYFKSSGHSYENWLKALQKNDYPRNYRLTKLRDNTTNECNECFISDFFITPHGLKPIVVGIGSYKSILFKAVEDFDWLKDCSVQILDNGNEFYFNNSGNKQSNDSENQIITTRSVVSVDASILNITTTTPKNVLLQYVDSLSRLFLFSLIFSIIIFIIFTTLAIRKNYGSLSMVLKKFSLDPSVDGYNKLIESIDKSHENQRNLKMEYEKNKKFLKYSALSQLLQSGYLKDKNDTLENYNINFSGDYFLVIAFKIHNMDNLYNGDFLVSKNELFHEVRSIMANVFEELISSESYRGYVTDVNDVFVCLCNLNDSTPSLSHILLEKALKGADYLNTYFGLDMAVALSDIYQGLSSIPSACKEAIKALSHISFYGIGDYILSSELNIKENELFYLPLQEVASRFHEALSQKNANDATMVINHVMHKIRSAKDVSIEYAKLIFINLASCILSTNDNIHDSLQISEILEINNLKDMEKFLTHHTNKICAEKKSDSKPRELSLAEQVRAYILDNYKNPDLNISMISMHFNLTVPYISSIYKDEYGQSLLDFIHKYRLSKAKELMQETNLTISSIAQLTGFSQMRTFNRIFKKHENMTPVEYRNSLNQ